MIKVHMILPDRLYQRGDLLRHPRAAKEELITRMQLRLIAGLYGPADGDLQALLGDLYVHNPIPDGVRTDFEALEVIARRALELTAGGRECAILTLCHAGRNRSGLLSAMIVRQLLRVSGTEALRLVRAGRPRAVANPHFAAYLEELTAP